MNVNVLDRETLLDAMDHPEQYPQLTIRVSGYAVNFVRLTREQQLDVIYRTFHEGCETPGASSSTPAGRSTPGTSPPAWTAPAPGSCCSSPAARCAACTARTPTPGTCATASGRTVDDVHATRSGGTGGSSQVAGGGVTVSGGEPLLQPEFTADVLRRVPRQLGLHTALDTSGLPRASAPTTRCSTVTDLVLLDIKSFDPARTAGDRAGTSSRRWASPVGWPSAARPMWIRFVLVPGLTDDPANVAGLADFVAGLGPASSGSRSSPSTGSARRSTRRCGCRSRSRHPRPGRRAHRASTQPVRRTQPARAQRLALRGGSTIFTDRSRATRAPVVRGDHRGNEAALRAGAEGGDWLPTHRGSCRP